MIKFPIQLCLASLIMVSISSSGISSAVEISEKANELSIINNDLEFPVSMASPEIIINSISCEKTLPVKIDGDIKSGNPIVVEYDPIDLGDSSRLDIRQYFLWTPKSSILHRWVDYRYTGDKEPIIQEIIFDSIVSDTIGVKLIDKQTVFLSPHSYPIFFEGFFAGIEFPIASTRIDGNKSVIAYKPGIKMSSGIWYQSRKAVYGATPEGFEWLHFRRYIESNRPEPRGSFSIYDNWITTANSYTEKEMLDLIGLLKEKLYKQNNLSLDAFRLVCTWSDPNSIWKIDCVRLPDGLSNFKKSLDEMKSGLGLWISPASCYPFAQNPVWAGENGYETFSVNYGAGSIYHTCIGGRKYKIEFTNNLVDMVKTYDLKHIQFDGYRFECGETGHGHEPGTLSADAIAQGMIDVFNAVRDVSPEIYLHGAYGGNPSPWWLFYINSFLVYYGDDAPFGKVPSPSYRESYITARDMANIQSSYYTPAPISAHDVYGLYDHAPFPFVNDAVMSVMRGHMTNSIIVNPKYKTDLDWSRIADIAKWSRKNQNILAHTEPLLPLSWQNGKCPKINPTAPVPIEPYGYAHFKGSSGLVALRNPWIDNAYYDLKLDEQIGFNDKSANVSAISIYPEIRLYSDTLKYGDTIRIPLMPYELVVLSIKKGQQTDNIKPISDLLNPKLRVEDYRVRLSKVKFNESDHESQPDVAEIIDKSQSVLKIDMSASIDVGSDISELLILLQDKDKPVPDPICNISVNNMNSKISYSDSETGFAATGLPRPEHWLYLSVPLQKGINTVSIDMLAVNDAAKVSIWAIASKSGDIKKPKFPNALPQPEIINLDSINLLPPTSVETIGLNTEYAELPINKINGIYLDSAENIEISGAAVKNTNFLNSDIFVSGRRFVRGFCVIAPSSLKIPLNGIYKKFCAKIGLDQGMASYDKSGVVFRVVADGNEVWKSDIITRYSPLVDIDIDLTGVNELELIVDEGSQPDPVYRANWSVWGNAQLLK